MPIAGNQALYSVIGTYYGGDGRTTFALPDLRGRIPVGVGAGTNLSEWQPGTKMGTEYVTLTKNEMPGHTHSVNGSTDTSDSTDPNEKLLGTDGSDTPYLPSSGSPQAMSPDAMMPAGRDEAHYNMAPAMALNYIIALEGLYPPRS